MATMGLQFINFGDYYNRWDLDLVVEITTKIQKWARKQHHRKNVELVSVEDNRWEDKDNQRIDVLIRYKKKDGFLYEQKLLILKGEVIDAKTLHKRFTEFYSYERS